MCVISHTPDSISHPYCHHPFHCACYTSVGLALLPPSIIQLDIQPSGHCSQPVPLTPESSDLQISRLPEPVRIYPDYFPTLRIQTSGPISDPVRCLDPFLIQYDKLVLFT
jgi:hypothetical protein